LIREGDVYLLFLPTSKGGRRKKITDCLSSRKGGGKGSRPPYPPVGVCQSTIRRHVSSFDKKEGGEKKKGLKVLHREREGGKRRKLQMCHFHPEGRGIDTFRRVT